MKITQEVNIDVVNYGSPPVIYATQGDTLIRQIKINLRSNGKSLEIPADYSGIVRYKREDGHGGNYDTNSNGEKAVEFSGSAAVVQIAPSVLSFPGIVDFVLAIVHGDSVLHTFSLQINVKENPGVSGSENDGFYWAGTLPDSEWEPNKYLGTDAQGKVITKNAPGNSETGVVGNITVEVDTDTMTANYTNTQIIEHLENGGTAMVKVSSSGAYFQLYGIVGTTVMFGAPAVNEAEQVELVIYSFWASGSVSKDVFTMGGSGGTGKPFKDIEVTENADGSVTIENTFTDGTFETITLAAGEKPDSIDYNGVAIPIGWKVET